MFEFYDSQISSQLSRSVVTVVDCDVDFGFSLIVNNREIVLTESELQYMIEQVENIKLGVEDAC